MSNTFESEARKLIDHHHVELREVAIRVSERAAWDLSLPVAVIDARKQPSILTVTSVGTIGSVLRTSTVIGNPLIRSFLSLYGKTKNAEGAIESFINDPQTGQEFAELYERYREEKREGGLPMWSVEDASRFVIKSREAFSEGDVSLIAILDGCEISDHRIITFGSSIRSLRS